MLTDDNDRAVAKHTLHQIIELLDEEIARLDAEVTEESHSLDPARRSLRPEECN